MGGGRCHHRITHQFSRAAHQLPYFCPIFAAPGTITKAIIITSHDRHQGGYGLRYPFLVDQIAQKIRALLPDLKILKVLGYFSPGGAGPLIQDPRIIHASPVFSWGKILLQYIPGESPHRTLCVGDRFFPVSSSLLCFPLGSKQFLLVLRHVFYFLPSNQYHACRMQFKLVLFRFTLLVALWPFYIDHVPAAHASNYTWSCLKNVSGSQTNDTVFSDSEFLLCQINAARAPMEDRAEYFSLGHTVPPERGLSSHDSPFGASHPYPTSSSILLLSLIPTSNLDCDQVSFVISLKVSQDEC